MRTFEERRRVAFRRFRPAPCPPATRLHGLNARFDRRFRHVQANSPGAGCAGPGGRLGFGAGRTLSLDQIVVTATRIAGTILASPDHVTVVSGEQLAAAVSVADALQEAAGVSVADNGTAGSVQSLSLRGSTAAQVLILVDGVRLNDSRQGGADLSQIPVDNIERIEIVRGGTSALYGADAVAGVVNIITKTKADQTLQAHRHQRKLHPARRGCRLRRRDPDRRWGGFPGPGRHPAGRGCSCRRPWVRPTSCSPAPSPAPTTASSGTTASTSTTIGGGSTPACWRATRPVH